MDSTITVRDIFPLFVNADKIKLSWDGCAYDFWGDTFSLSAFGDFIVKGVYALPSGGKEDKADYEIQIAALPLKKGMVNCEHYSKRPD